MNPSVHTSSFSGVDVEPPPQLPIEGKGYFACRNCKRILNETQWYEEGCAECLTGPISRGDLTEYATGKFRNFIGLIGPEKSWVGKLIGKTQCPNGIYAEMLSDEDELDEDDFDDEPSDEGAPNEIEEIEAI